MIVLALALLAQPAVARTGEVVALPQPEAHRLDDAELVARARRGDEWAHEMIYRRYVQLVAATARRMLRAPADVDDIVQETFLIAFEKIDKLLEPRALRGWLAQIAVSRVHRRFRVHRWIRLGVASDIGASLAEQASQDATQEQRAELSLIDRALRDLPLKLRTPWVLRHVVGLELGDVAVACECSLATAKRRLAEAGEHVEAHLSGGDA